MLSPNEYGRGTPAGYRPVPLDIKTLSFRQSGLDFSKPADELDEGQTPYCQDVRLNSRGITPDYALSEFGDESAGAGDLDVVGMAPFEIADETKYVMRLRPTKWDRWDGTNWLELNGVLTGTPTDPLYTAAYGDRFIGANFIDRLKSWDGVDANAVADLSADAPIAAFIVKIGTRLLAAKIRSGGNIFPFDLQWCADGIVTDWTSAANGAGGVSLQPEGTNEAANVITGLSALQGAAVIYRQKTIMLGLLTGIGAAPFKFSTIDFGQGTLSPWSIARGGMKVGDYFLGDDYMPYFFDGRAVPTAIGDPIYDVLRSNIFNPKYVFGGVSRRTQTFWLAYATDATFLLKQAYIFSIRDWVEKDRLVWWKRDLGDGYRSMATVTVPVNTDPFMDDVDDIVDTLPTRVDEYAATVGNEQITFGDTEGQAWYVNLSTRLTSGVFHTRPIGDGETLQTLGRVRLTAAVSSVAQVEVSVSTDGGLNFTNTKTLTFAVSGSGVDRQSEYWGQDFTTLQFQIRILSGSLTISQLAYVLDNHGRA